MQAITHTGATKIDLAWAAGLFEGEGCITLNIQRDRPQATCLLQMSDEDVVRRFHAMIGIGSVCHTPRPEDRKNLWSWRASGYRSAQYVIALLWQWLGERRQARAVEVLRAGAATPSRKKAHCVRGHDLGDPANVYEHTRLSPVTPGRAIRTRHCLECRRIQHANRVAKRQEKALVSPQ